MSAVRNLRAPWGVPPLRTVPDEAPKPRGVQLRPIPWGKRDADLGRLVCRHMADANPPTVIPYNPSTDARIRNDLRKLRVEHY